MENIYRTNLVYLGLKEEIKELYKDEKISINVLSCLEKKEVIVVCGYDGIYRELITGRAFQSIDCENLNPSYECGPYYIKPSLVNDRLDNSIKGYDEIKSYIENHKNMYGEIDDFIYNEEAKDLNRQFEDIKKAKYMKKSTENMILELKK